MWWRHNPYQDEWFDKIEDLGRRNSRPFDDWFENQDRVYFPFDPDYVLEFSKNDQDVIELLEEKGFEVHDYKGGYCRRPGTSQQRRIGKVINSIKRADFNEVREKHQAGHLHNIRRAFRRLSKYYDEIMKHFTASPYRNASEIATFSVVISQNPHDIAKISTDRNWESCMTLGTGQYHQEIFKEVKSGGMVAYLIRTGDTEIEKPIARIWIRRFENQEEDSIAKAEDSIYGEDVEGFKEAVDEWIDENQGPIRPGVYHLKGAQYSDSFSTGLHLGGSWEMPDTPSGILKYYRGEGLDDIPYKIWEVHNQLHWYDTDDDGEELETATFYSQGAAEDYVWNHRLSYDSDWREQEDEGIDEEHWTLTDEDGEYVHEPLSIEEKVIDKRPELQAQAASKIAKARRGIYPIEVIEEIKDKYPTLRNVLLTNYPELFTREELQRLSRYELVKFIDALPESQRAPHIQQVEDQFAAFVEEPARYLPLCVVCEGPINPETDDVVPCQEGREMFHHADCPRVCEIMTEADSVRYGKEKIKHSYFESSVYGLHDLLDPYLHFHSYKYPDADPVPEALIQKLITVPERTYLRGRPLLRSKANILHFLHMVHADTPVVQQFYESLLPYWRYEFEPWTEEEKRRPEFMRRDRIIYMENLGSAIAALGENGRRFIPFIRSRLDRIKEDFGDIAFDPNIEPTGHPWSEEYRDLEHLQRITEKYLYILDALESGTGRSKKYDFSQWV